MRKYRIFKIKVKNCALEDLTLITGVHSEIVNQYEYEKVKREGVSTDNRYMLLSTLMLEFTV